jgi:hypothetical protein
MPQPDISHLIATVCARHKIRLDADDPAIITVEVARLALEESVTLLLERATPLADRISTAGLGLAAQLSKQAAQQISAETQAARKAIASEAQTARDAAAMAINKLAQAHRSADSAKWICVGVALGVLLSAAAFAAGYALAPTIDGHGKVTG